MRQEQRLQTNGGSLSLRTGVRTRTLSDERLRFCRQIGVEDIFLDHRDPRGDVFADEGSQDEETITIDDELIEAAQLDGAGLFAIYRNIILPLSYPMFAVVAIFKFTQIWNEFFYGLVILHWWMSKR